MNWLNPFGRAIAYGGLGEEAFKTIVCSIFSNTAWMEPMVIRHPVALKDISVENLVRSRTDYDEPALIPPLENYKDYEKVKRYIGAWNFAESLLRNASELVVVGCSIRPEDENLRELLSKSVRKDTSITVVDRNPKLICDRLSKILRKGIWQE